MSAPTMLFAATCIALPIEEAWLGVLLTGPSGAGKSELALRLIEAGARLVADDQTTLALQDEGLEASAPDSIAGLIEMRGVGIVGLPAGQRLARVEPVAVIELVEPARRERMPDPAVISVLGRELPRWQIAPFEAAAVDHIKLAVAALAAGRQSARNTALPQPAGQVAQCRPVVLITGLSGAGRLTALKALEDLGYVGVDNMPLPLLESLLRTAAGDDRYPVAFGVDVRTWGFDGQAVAAHIEELRRRADLRLRVVYLDCDTDVLLRRYTETRRPHPLARDRPVQDAIADERRRLVVLRDTADLTIDTSTLSPHDLKRVLAGHFALDAGLRLRISIVSFSFGRGLPREADMVLDARFLRNPHYVVALRPLDGRDPAVRDYVAADSGWRPFIERVDGLLSELLPRFDAEGKTYLTIAIGCTGGRHRSVAAAVEIGRRLQLLGREVAVSHRDVALASGAQGTAQSAAAMFPLSASSRNIAPEGAR